MTRDGHHDFAGGENYFCNLDIKDFKKAFKFIKTVTFLVSRIIFFGYLEHYKYVIIIDSQIFFVYCVLHVYEDMKKLEFLIFLWLLLKMVRLKQTI